MPLQILIATFLALLILGGITKAGSTGQQAVKVVNEAQDARVIKYSHAGIIVITTVESAGNKITIVGQKHRGNVQSIFTGNTTLPVNETKNYKRKIIVRAA